MKMFGKHNARRFTTLEVVDQTPATAPLEGWVGLGFIGLASIGCIAAIVGAVAVFNRAKTTEDDLLEPVQEGAPSV